MEQNTEKKALTLKTLTKSSVWDIQENDIFRLCEGAEKDAEVKDNLRHYTDIIRSAFMIEEIDGDSKLMKQKYEKQGYQVGTVKLDEGQKVTWAVKKRPITRVTDLTYENVRHITAAKLVEVIDRNFGGGWESLSQSVQDIIESGFDISTTTLPKDRLKKPGGMYDKKVADGFEVLEIAKGTWVEAIFAKEKPEMEKPRITYQSDLQKTDSDNYDNDDEDLPEIEDHYNDIDEDDEFDEDKLTEESYRTTFETNPEDLELADDEVVDDEY